MLKKPVRFRDSRHGYVRFIIVKQHLTLRILERFTDYDIQIFIFCLFCVKIVPRKTRNLRPNLVSQTCVRQDLPAVPLSCHTIFYWY